MNKNIRLLMFLSVLALLFLTFHLLGNDRTFTFLLVSLFGILSIFSLFGNGLFLVKDVSNSAKNNKISTGRAWAEIAKKSLLFIILPAFIFTTIIIVVALIVAKNN